MSDGFEIAWERARDVMGWYSREELEFLWQQIQALDSLSNVLEIGCYYGRSTSVLAEVCARRGAMLSIIDPFYHRGECIPKAKKNVIKILEDSSTTWSLMEGWSKEVNPGDLPAQLDSVHIDGSHEAEDVAIDCRLALPKLRIGGIVAFHDWADYMPGVVLGATEFVKNFQTVGQVGSVRVFRK